MTRFAGGPIVVKVIRPQRNVAYGSWPVVYTALDGEALAVSPFIPGQGSEGETYPQWKFTLWYPLAGPLDIRVSDLLQDVTPSGASTDPITGEATTWVVRWDQGFSVDHLELLCTIDSSIR